MRTTNRRPSTFSLQASKGCLALTILTLSPPQPNHKVPYANILDPNLIWIPSCFDTQTFLPTLRVIEVDEKFSRQFIQQAIAAPNLPNTKLYSWLKLTSPQDPHKQYHTTVIVLFMSQCKRIFGDIFTFCPINLKFSSIISTFQMNSEAKFQLDSTSDEEFPPQNPMIEASLSLIWQEVTITPKIRLHQDMKQTKFSYSLDYLPVKHVSVVGCKEMGLDF